MSIIYAEERRPFFNKKLISEEFFFMLMVCDDNSIKNRQLEFTGYWQKKSQDFVLAGGSLLVTSLSPIN